MPHSITDSEGAGVARHRPAIQETTVRVEGALRMLARRAVARCSPAELERRELEILASVCHDFEREELQISNQPSQLATLLAHVAIIRRVMQCAELFVLFEVGA